MEQKSINNTSSFNPKEKSYTLQNLIAKLNKTEPSTFGNYYVNFNEMFQKEEDYKDYMKKHVSLFNDDLVNKDKYEVPMESFFYKRYIEKFHDTTLFYFFYYLTRDTLQLLAAEQLYKRGWKYHSSYQIWFKPNKNEEGKEILEYFNPLEWTNNEYIYGKIEPSCYLDEEEVKKYSKMSDNESNKKDKKVKQAQKGSSGNNNDAKSGNNGNNNNSGNVQTNQGNNNA